VEKYGGAKGAADDNTIWRMHFECWVSKVTYAHAPMYAPTHTHAHTHKYVILTPFPRQQWLRERASI
jgi:hypothetical protein